MKTRAIFLWMMAVGLCWAATGCSNNKIDTVQVRSAFSSEPREAQALIDASMHDVDTSNYMAALKPLQVLGFKYKLSAPERKVLADTVRKIRIKAGLPH